MNVLAEGPASPRPILIRKIVRDEHVDVHFYDPGFFQTVQTTGDKLMANSTATIRWIDHHMLQVAPAAIMSGHRATDDFAVLFGHEAEAWIPRQVACRGFSGISIAH